MSQPLTTEEAQKQVDHLKAVVKKCRRQARKYREQALNTPMEQWDTLIKFAEKRDAAEELLFNLRYELIKAKIDLHNLQIAELERENEAFKARLREKYSTE